MTKKDKFDNIIKNNLSKAYGNNLFGYVTDKIRDKYYNNNEFNNFICEMQTDYEDAYKKYKGGSGSELIPHKSSYGLMPPKMASVASSSRFCYLALRDGTAALGGGGKAEFEYACKIKDIKGNSPQLDAYIENGNIFVEAKCHEIFDSHKIILSEAYREIIADKNKGFGIETKAENGKIYISPSVFNISPEKINTMFDIKQLLCHLLGVSAKSSEENPATLVYLFFKPIAEDEQDKSFIKNTFDELADEINAIFTSAPVSAFIKNHHITLKAFAQECEEMCALTKDNLKELYR